VRAFVALEGLVVPIPTLFGPDGSLEPDRTATFVRDLLKAGVDHIFAMSSVGEFPSLAPPERGPLLEAVRRAVDGPHGLWVGCGAPSTAQAVAYATEAEAAGASVLVAVPPYYLHPTPASIARYYRAIRAATDLPLLAYNIPSLVGYALSPVLLHELGREKVLSGTKDTSGTIASVIGFLNAAPDGFAVFPGDDKLARMSVMQGASGAVMGLANIVPRLGVRLMAALRDKDTARSLELQALVDELWKVTQHGPFPSTDKFLAERLRGAKVGYRAPYDPLTPAEERAVLDALKPNEARFREFL
jgi:4-hydroxy-tetrahydrodipicolinate synthase